MAFTDELARYGAKVRFQPQDEHGLLDLAGYLGLVQHHALICVSRCLGAQLTLDL